MKAYDIIKQLHAVVPKYTDKFSEQFSITSLTKSGAVATATATAHGLDTLDNVFIKGAALRNPITALTRIGSIAIAHTQYAHDLTFNAKEDKYITIGGATQADYNGSKLLLAVPSKTSFQFEVSSSAITPATGSPYLQEDLFLYNGAKQITKLTDDTFSYPLRMTPYANASGTIIGHKNIRISGAATFDRCLSAYTSKAQNVYWMFIVLGAANASKGRYNQTDSTNRFTAQTDFRLNIYQPFSVYVIMPAIQTLAARELRDEIEDMRVWLFKALCGVKFSSGFSGAQKNFTSYVGDDVEQYDAPFYIHKFNFENMWDTTETDIVDEPLNVAWRSFEISQKNLTTGLEIRNIKGELP
jgi:hypothetical protein